MKKSKTIGVVVGRFQVPELHEAHKQIISMARLENSVYIVFIACTDVKGSPKDPLDYNTRAQMVKYQFPDAIVKPIHDSPSDEIWSKDLDGSIIKLAGKWKVLLYSGHGGFAKYYHGRFPVKNIKEIDFYRGTEIREIAGSIVPASKEGRCGVIYGVVNQYPRAYPTVDIAVINKGNVLLGIKRDQEGLRFPGGFVDPSDESLEAAAKRECKEECGDIETDQYEYICSGRVDDWRYRNRDEKIISSFFKCKYIYGSYHEACASIDSEFTKLAFYPVNLDTMSKMAHTHRPFFIHLNENMKGVKVEQEFDYSDR